MSEWDLKNRTMRVEYDENIRCPICNGMERTHHYFQKGGNNPSCTFVRCLECTVIFQSPMPTLAWLSKYYQSAYRERGHSGGVQKRNLTEEKIRGAFNLQLIEEDRERVGAHLDVGSSTGTFLKLVQGRYGCTSAGVEPNHKFREFSRDMFAGRLYESLFSIEDQVYDLITCVHTLEHIKTPILFLEHMIRLLSTATGLLFLEVPFGNPKQFRFPHLLAFNPMSMKRLLTTVGIHHAEITTGSGSLWVKARL